MQIVLETPTFNFHLLWPSIPTIPERTWRLSSFYGWWNRGNLAQRNYLFSRDITIMVMFSFDFEFVFDCLIRRTWLKGTGVIYVYFSSFVRGDILFFFRFL